MSGNPFGSQGGASATDLVNAALGRARQGDVAGASALVDRALQMEPRNPAVLTGRAIIYRVEGRMREAVLACDQAIAIEPRMAGAWLERGNVLANGGSPELARESFRKAAKLAPQLADAHANVASLAARDGDMKEARKAAWKALKLDPANLVAANAMASVHLSDGEAQRALDLLAPLVERFGPGDTRATALSLMGRAHEKLGDHAKAYEHFVRSKQDFAGFTSAIRQGRLSNTDFIHAIREGFATVDPACWTSPLEPLDNRPSPVFLLGYPRSGTTLVENILASIEGVAALEERPTLIETEKRYLLGDRDSIVAGLGEFAAASSDALAQQRDGFWDKVFASGVPKDSAHYVDMDPLKGSRLPFIARLLPQARIVIMRRDPRDVVWSCFRTDFAIANSTLEYTSLESTARHYDALMRMTEAAREVLPLAFHELRYEALVADFEATTKDLCAFAGLPWSEAVGDFARTADKRGVATASAGQVRKGLYDGSRQWEPYAEYLEPVLPILAPWIEKFGYS